MFRYIVTLLLFSNIVYAMPGQSKDLAKELLCAVESATYYKRVLENQTIEVDKYRHCSVSCVVGIECGIRPSAIIGVAKEVYDLFGGGTPEFKDLLANIIGLKFSQDIEVQNFEDCSRRCHQVYMKELSWNI